MYRQKWNLVEYLQTVRSDWRQILYLIETFIHDLPNIPRIMFLSLIPLYRSNFV